ncbi:hypothetical protein [Streptomyces sp. NPDC059802]|uniref:hypothetical protein n=1 Tax=Streptomyces sp. NPDC059802 TaxID=3346952 RepID=UPI00365D0DC8
MAVTTLPMPVSEAINAPLNLGKLAAAATDRGWGAMVERAEERDAWTLVVSAPSDSRTGRYTWCRGKWATAGRSYRDTMAWFRSATDAAPSAVDVAPAVDAETSALAVLNDASRKITDAVAEARKAVEEAEGCHAEACAAGEAAETAWTTSEAEEWAEAAEQAVERAPEYVKRAKSALRRVQAQRRAIQAAVRAVEELGLDEGFRRIAVEAEETVRELLGEAEEAAEEAQNWAEAARGTAELVCLRCGCFVRGTACGCRAAMLATLDRAGSTVARVVDAEAVRIGYLLDSDDAARVVAGQLMLAGGWEEAEEALAEAEGPAEAEERRTSVRVAEAVIETQRAAARPAEREAARRAAECAEAAEAAAEHSGRAAEAYEITRDLMMYTLSAWAARPVDLLPEAEAAEARALLGRIDRRSRVAHDVDCGARWEWYDGSPVTDPQRSRDCANRARVLAVGCERDARQVAELFAWAEYAERAEAEAAERAEAEAAERAEAKAGVPLAPAPVATGPRVVPVAECAARAEAEAARLDLIARERHAWMVDMKALVLDVREGNVLGVDVADARGWSERAASVAASAAMDAERARWEAQRWVQAAERAVADMEAMRTRTARLFSGEGDDRSRWVSADGRTVIALALSTEADTVMETDARFAGVLAGAVAAKDAGRLLKSSDIPTKAKHGRGPGTEFKQAVTRASRPLIQPWKAPRIPAEGKPLDGAALAVLDADGVCAEVEAAPGVWLPRAAVYVAETAAANGWAVAMERQGSSTVIVRAAGVLARAGGPVAGEIVAVWTDGMYDACRSDACVGGRWLGSSAELSRVLTTIGQVAEAVEIATAGMPKGTSAPAPAGVSDPGSAEEWESDGGAVPGVAVPRPKAAEPVSDAPAAPMRVDVPRYRFGRYDDRGRCPVAVDGELVGHVYRIRRTWHAIGLSEKYATSHTCRGAAATRVVALIDMRAAVEADVARKMRRRTEAPPGWRCTTWDAVGPGDIVRTPVRCRPVRGASLADGPLYPELWGAPVTLTGVDHLSNGSVVSRGKTDGAPAWSGIGVLLPTPEFAEVGILVLAAPPAEAPAESPAATPAESPAEAIRERAPPHSGPASRPGGEEEGCSSPSGKEVSASASR